MKYIFSTILFLSFLLSACATASTPTLINTDATPIIATTPTPLQTQSPSSTATASTPSTATFVPLFTPQPKLSKSASLVRVRNLLTSNHNCSLPCWWNITPGKTDIREAINELRRFAGYEKFSINDGTIVSSFSFVSDPSSIEFVDMILTSQGDTVDQIDITPPHSWKYQLPALLHDYGAPTSIWIRTFKPDYDKMPLGYPYNAVPVYIVLFYQDKGIAAMFAETTEQTIDSEVHGCFLDIAELALWSPNQQLTFDDISKKWGNLPYMQIDDATKMTKIDFFDLYKNGEHLPCIKTPADLWPDL